MTDLITNHRPYIKHIEKLRQSFNDSEKNPLFNDGFFYKSCDLIEQKQDGSSNLKEKLNFMVILFDSTSYNQFRRIFPLTFKYLNGLKNNFIFENFNVVGANTYPNIVPFFTGLNINPNIQLNLTNEANYLKGFNDFQDFLPFIWKDYEQENYLSIFDEDDILLGTYNYAKKGNFY